MNGDPKVHISLFSNTEDVNIQGGSFTLQTNIRYGLAEHELRAILDSGLAANAKQNDDLAHFVESRFQKFSRDLEDHLNVASSVSMLDGLLSSIQQLVKHLPVAHRELAQQFAGSVRPHTTLRSFRDNLTLVATPLLSSSIFSTLSVEVQFLVVYFLVAMISMDLFLPRLTYRPSSRVSVLDALGKYHDFPWSACVNPKTFHAEFLRRFLNQTGFSFVKSRLYEVEYDGCIMKPEDWAAVKPFTDLCVDFIQIQPDLEESRVVNCPWCGRANPLPGAKELTTICSCSGCERDFSTAVASVESVDRPPILKDNNISLEIRRFRVRLLEYRKPSFLTSPYMSTRILVPFVCEYCRATFTRSQNLRYHIDAHFGIKRYDALCGKKFGTPSGLKRHQHQCPNCQRLDSGKETIPSPA